jgi:glycosyltransferase involved in cell wall biosynthesis
VEAAHYGVPAAAFNVGGISDWLQEGVNGALAPGGLPTSHGLADAICRCLADRKHHARLRQGALEMAGKFTMENHLSLLIPLLENAAR